MKEKFKNQRGASMVEFAIVLPLLLVLVFGIIEFGLLLYNKAMVTNASREGARAGAVFNANSDGDYSPLDTTYITNIVNSYSANHLVTFGTPNLTIIPNTCTSRGSNLTVTVTYPYTFLTFSNLVKLIGPGTIPGTITLTAVSVMRCE